MSEEVSDQQRYNNVTAAVQGCLYQNINKRCIDKLMIMNNDISSCHDEEHKEKVSKLLCIAKTLNCEATSAFVKSQKSISTRCVHT